LVTTWSPSAIHFALRLSCTWAANLDGALHRVRVAHRRLIAPQEFSFLQGELRLH
jgi:uncharacterized protein Usg